MIAAYLLALSAIVQAPTPPAQTTPVPPAADKQVCRVEGQTGSRLRGARVCRTKAEWDRLATGTGAAAEALRRTQPQ